MIQFILNDLEVKTESPPGTTLLDCIRYEQGLTGTKIGCREGDCGACTVLEGRLEDDCLTYRSMVSCLTPLGQAHGKHIVTVEGLNMEALSPVQQAFVDYSASQCGFCTPGFVVSLTGHAMSPVPSQAASAIACMDGNICRCTGYKSIERAAISVHHQLKEKNPDNPIQWLVENGFLPDWFRDIPERMARLHRDLAAADGNMASEGLPGRGIRILGGGTDLMVQQPEVIAGEQLALVLDHKELKGIHRQEGRVLVGASVTATELMESPLMQSIIPDIASLFKLISSGPIRNMGTLAGNIVNASPIADLSIIFLALKASVLLAGKDGLAREVPLKDFFLDYKKLDLQEGEYIRQVSFPCPPPDALFHFEKVSKRTHLDIASVNSAMLLHLEGDRILDASLSLGGVAPVPLYLKKTSALLQGRSLSEGLLRKAIDSVQQEIAPISDIRGSARYKRLLARQLFFAHWEKHFPGRFDLPVISS